MGGEERREGRNERERDPEEEEIERERAGVRRKEEREGEVSLSVARRREATQLFSIAIICPSRAWKRGSRNEERERGKNSPLRAHAWARERRRVGERGGGRKFSPPHARMQARARR